MSEVSNNEKDEQSERPQILRLMSNPRVLFGAVCVYAGVGIPVLLRTESDLLMLLKGQVPTLIGIVAALLGFLMMSSEISKLRVKRKEERFIDVDDRRESNSSDLQIKILNDIKSLKDKSNSLSPEKIEELISKASESRIKENSELFDSFENYFNDVREVLIEQAHTADKKASILLDKGTAYSKGGITFFITSIVVWQILSSITGFQEQYIYGIVSCSLLFIFIEFLAAWFLKQYRHFVDTSTYHIKVKSIFDKYMMSFLAIKSLGSEAENEESKYQAMLKILEEDIKWPETYLLKNGDVSFAKEAMETMTHFAKAMKSEVKNQAK
ncbi:TPA: hypothetical protein KDY87_004236 [Vibrio parahaemolyticus]|nr:hypothetical protein [Vibrio parahaemolyticus]